jgi:ABC-type proline/glycine betaine transport system substrate-binding protein
VVVVVVLTIAVALGSPTSASAQASDNNDRTDLVPGSGETLVVGRPTWDTGWFQAEILAQMLGELGYVIDGPITYGNEDFYREVQTGNVDLWANGWFPLHDQLLPEVEASGAKRVGFEVKGGALQGYMADLATIEESRIETLGDLADPEIAAQFDRDGDGKADLIGCNLDWACHPVVEHHLEAYGLSDTVEQISSDYGPLMQSAANRYAQGQPVLYYTYTPNWTGGVLVPGRDVAWVPVPEPSLPPEMADQEADTVVADVEGCLTDPCGMGFAPNDIRSVANSRLLEDQPAIASLLEQFTISLDEVSTQNALMFRGEDSSIDIEQHAANWIRDNRATVDRWLGAATEAHLDAGLKLGPRPASTDANRIEVGTIRVATRTAPPFITFDEGVYAGFTMELLDVVAEEIGADLEIYGVTSNAKLIDDVARGEADVGAGALAITSERERRIDFSQPYFDSGLQILVPTDDGGGFGRRLGAVARTVFSGNLLLVCLTLVVVLVIAAHIVWLAERKNNPEFPQSYRAGIWEAFWWAAVTATTVGYGDKTPKGVTGRVFGLLWMFVGLFVLAYFTAGIASAFTLDELQAQISGPADLRGRNVGVVADSLAEEYLRSQGIPATEYVSGEEAYDALVNGSLDAIVHDAAILQHFVTENVEGDVEITGVLFAERGFGFALASDSELAEALNRGLIGVIESGEYKQLHDKWFGADQ